MGSCAEGQWTVGNGPERKGYHIFTTLSFSRFCSALPAMMLFDHRRSFDVYSNKGYSHVFLLYCATVLYTYTYCTCIVYHIVLTTVQLQQSTIVPYPHAK